MKLFFLVVCTDFDTREDVKRTATTTYSKQNHLKFCFSLLSIDSLCVHGLGVLLVPSSSYSQRNKPKMPNQFVRLGLLDMLTQHERKMNAATRSHRIEITYMTAIPATYTYYLYLICVLHPSNLILFGVNDVSPKLINISHNVAYTRN